MKTLRIDHIALYVNDLEATREFFVRYLGGISNDGYYNARAGFRSYFISFDGGARLELMKKPGMTDAEKALNRTGYAHVAFGVGSREKVDALTAELRSAGYTVVSGPRTTGDGYSSHTPAVINRILQRHRQFRAHRSGREVHVLQSLLSLSCWT